MRNVPGVERSRAVDEAGWVAERLEPFDSGLVTSVVPGGFAAYARVLHPAEAPRNGHGRTVRWAEVAEWSGVPLEADSQFHDIALPEREPGAPAPWKSQGPEEGTLTADDAVALTEILRAHTAGSVRCWFCVWDGWGLDHSVTLTAASENHSIFRVHAGARLPRPAPAPVRDEGPLVHLPGRDYQLYAGPVEAAAAFARSHGHTPNLWWPADRAWCVASEIDLPWSYVGGPATLIHDVLTDSRVEAMPARPDGNHHFRVRGWLADAIAAATARLLEAGQVTIETSRGTVHAALRRPGRWARGLLRISSHGKNGVSHSSGHDVKPAGEEELRREVELDLTLAVTGLVSG